MKKLILILMMLPFFAMAQTGNDTTKYYKSYDYGWSWPRVWAKSALILPTDTTVNKFGVAVIGTVLYIGDGTKWAATGGGLGNTTQYTLLGRASGSGAPSYLGSIDSNWIPTLHSEQYYNTKYAAIGAGGTNFDTTKFNNSVGGGYLLFNQSYFNNLTGWTATGFTPSSVASFMRLSGGDGTFGKYVVKDNYVFPQINKRAEVTFTISNTISSGYFGIAVGFRSINTWWNPSVVAQYDPYTKVIKIIQVNTTTVLVSKNLDYTPLQNDNIKITIEQIGSRFTAYFEDYGIGTGAYPKVDVLSVNANLDATKNFGIPNSSQVALYSMGGQIDVSSVKVSTSFIKNAWLNFITDSKGIYSSNDFTNAWTFLTAAKYGNANYYIGDGDRTVEVAQYIDSVLTFGGKYFVLHFGRNDLASSVSSGTWQANLVSIRNKIVAKGGTVIWLLPIPETNLADQSAVKNYINSTFLSDIRIDPSIGWDNSTMLSSDGVHPNMKGDRRIAFLIDSVAALTIQPNFAYTPVNPVPGVGEYIKGNGTIDYYPKFTGTGSQASGSIYEQSGLLFTNKQTVINNGSATTLLSLKGTNPLMDWVDSSTGVRYAFAQAQAGQLTLGSSRPGSKIQLTGYATSYGFYPNGSVEIPDAGFNYTGVSINLNSTSQAMLFNRLNTTQQGSLSTQLYGHFFNTDSLALVYRGASSANTTYATRDWVRAQGYGAGGGSTNTSVGSGYRVGINATNNIKSLTAKYGIILDSATTNEVGIKVDTSNLHTQAYYDARYSSIGVDSLYIRHAGRGKRIAFVQGDSLKFKTFIDSTYYTWGSTADSSFYFKLDTSTLFPAIRSTIGTGSGDMILAATQTVTGAKTFTTNLTLSGGATNLQFLDQTDGKTLQVYSNNRQLRFNQQQSSFAFQEPLYFDLSAPANSLNLHSTGTLRINSTSVSTDVASRGLYVNRSVGFNKDSIPTNTTVSNENILVVDQTTGQVEQISRDNFGVLTASQTITTGTATTINNNVATVIVDPASVLASHTITLPATPFANQTIGFLFGKQIAVGATVVTSLTISPNTGQTIYTAITPTTATGGDYIEFKWVASGSYWFRTK